MFAAHVSLVPLPKPARQPQLARGTSHSDVRRTVCQSQDARKRHASTPVKTARTMKATVLSGACLAVLFDAAEAYGNPLTDAISQVCDPFLCPGGNPVANPGFQAVLAVWVVPQAIGTLLLQAKLEKALTYCQENGIDTSELNVQAQTFSRALALVRSKAIMTDVKAKCIDNDIEPSDVLLSPAELAATELPKAAVKVQQNLRAKGVEYKFTEF